MEFCQASASLHPAIHFLSISYLHHKNDENFVPNLVNDAVVLPRPYVDAVELLLRLHLLHSVRTWIVLQAENVPGNLFPDMRIELTEVPLSGGRDVNAVGQVLILQLPHEIAERNGPLLFRLHQSGPGVFDVASVHFVLG
jgi:hypothetical protein